MKLNVGFQLRAGAFRVNESFCHTCKQVITSETVIPTSTKGRTFPPHAFTAPALAPVIRPMIDAGGLKPKAAAAALQDHVRETVTPRFASKVMEVSKVDVGGEDLELSCQEVPELCKLYEGQGHYCKYLTVEAKDMKKIMVDSARSEHKRKGDGGKFNPATVDTSAVKEGDEYYRGWLFAPCSSIEMMSQGTLTSQGSSVHPWQNRVFRDRGHGSETKFS